MADRNLVAPSTISPSKPDESLFQSACEHTIQQLWLGNLLDASGHADGNRAFLTSLERHGYEPRLRLLRWFKGGSAAMTQSDLQQIERQERRAITGPVVAVHSYPAWDKNYVVRNQVNVQRAVFETDRCPYLWLGPLMDREEIWVPSQFNYETFASSGIPEEKLKIVGDAIDITRFDPDNTDPYPLGAPEGHFTFLSNFDFSERKGWKQLLLAWAKAFSRHDPVCLVLKVGSFYADVEDVVGKIRSYIRDSYGAAAAADLAPIRFVTETLPTTAMPRLYAAADAYVLPSRGEGVGRPFMEAMAMRLPTIASNWSGNLEFMHPEETWLVDGEVVDVPEEVELANNLYDGHKWFEADSDELARILQEIAGNPEAARAKAAPARERIDAEFGTAAIGARLQELAEEAYARYGEHAAKPYAVAIRGPGAGADSLAVGNDALADGLTDRGYNFVRRGPSAPVFDEPIPGVSQSWPPVFDPATDGPTVLVLPWEFGIARQDWVDAVRRKVDRVLVPSEFVRQGYIESGIPAGVVETIHSGVDTDLFTPEGPKYPLERTDRTTFLFVGGSTWRKGIDTLLEGWRRAFSPDDDTVQLVIKDFGKKTSYKTSHNENLIQQAIASGSFAPIVYIDDDLLREELPALYRAADVMVLPYRAEGFCLPAAEAMAVGIPVIHNGSGPTGEFVGDIGGWALPAPRVPAPDWLELEPAADGKEYYIHEVAPEDLATALAEAAADPDKRAALGRAALEQAGKFTWKAFADKAFESLVRLQDEDLPLARTIRTAEIEAKEHFALLAPTDWSDDSVWGPALDAWLDAFGPEDDVTLALWADGDVDAIGGAIMSRLDGRDENRLPDLALVQPEESVTLIAVAATADAVLAIGTTEPSENPMLLRRAREIVPATPEGVREFAARLRPQL